jgi:hypothetical protein
MPNCSAVAEIPCSRAMDAKIAMWLYSIIVHHHV